MRKPYLYILAICFFCCEEAPDFLTVDPVDTPVVEIQTSEAIFTEFPIEIEWEGNAPALRIYPLSQTAQLGDEIDVYLYFEEVPEELAVTGLHVEIQINSDELEFITDQFELGELIDSFPGTTIYPNPSYSDDNTSVSIVGVAEENGRGIYGTGSIAKIRLKVLTCCEGQNININQIEVLNLNGDPYNTFNDPVSGTVTVVEAGQ